MNSKLRRSKIVEITNAEKKVEVNYLADLFSASKETIRRDLVVLSEKGLLRKMHGGAAAIQTAIESPASSRFKDCSFEKKKIANHAAALLIPGDSLFVDTGSTTYALCEGLCNSNELTIVTNSLMLALNVGAGSDHAIYLVGGKYDVKTSETYGNLALEMINKFHCDHAFITVGGIDLNGNCMDYNVDEAGIAEAMIQQARSVTILADHSKIGRKALCKVCDLSNISRIITDRRPSEEFINQLEINEVELIIAD